MGTPLDVACEIYTEKLAQALDIPVWLATAALERAAAKEADLILYGDECAERPTGVIK